MPNAPHLQAQLFTLFQVKNLEMQKFLQSFILITKIFTWGLHYSQCYWHAALSVIQVHKQVTSCTPIATSNCHCFVQHFELECKFFFKITSSHLHLMVNDNKLCLHLTKMLKTAQ